MVELLVSSSNQLTFKTTSKEVMNEIKFLEFNQ